ncbi:inner ear-specific collagen-like isoform X2 [Triplophysa rosa]|uniref:Collagen alpha-1III chain-like n=1 Tax=Triplophysa rosa TaxID=992332 RepID=A0A9W8C882_TRIRA|nr:inner ear-specific collagen-like isoform X2 [Triplophysa rosa]KAI7810133.1 putative collagen alpha-1III chain-like [Triplophysa rosa]
MAQDSFQIMIMIIVGLLVSSVRSFGMIIDVRGDLIHPPPGSPDKPIPPDDYFEGSAAHSDKMPMYSYDNYFMPKGDNAIAREAPMMPGYPMPILPIPPDRYPIMQPKPPTGNMTQGFRTVFTRQQPDFSYCDVLLEVPVPPPGDQMPWFCICQQCKRGPVAPKGDKGDKGQPGPSGSPGINGMKGFQGPPGFIGFRGPKGLKGDIGEKGDFGPSGFAGQKGLRGFKGDKGDMGVDGNPGHQGLPGERGECPAICYSMEGPLGETGPPGIVGERGLPGVRGSPGLNGQKGELGNSGPPGARGLNGQKGDEGEQGLCHCRDGVDGVNGTTGIRGENGSKGDDGRQGAAGVNGAKGQNGDPGETGVPGPCSPAIQSAFFVALSSSYPVPDMPVPFTNVIYNKGFNFDALTGVYRAPVNGTYVMTYHLAVYNRMLKVGLFHNFSPLVKSTGSTSLSTLSHQVILHLTVGDEVWIQVRDANSNGMYVSSEYSSSFSGFLLYPDSCDIPMSRELPEPINGTYSWVEL